MLTLAQVSRSLDLQEPGPGCMSYMEAAQAAGTSFMAALTYSMAAVTATCPSRLKKPVTHAKKGPHLGPPSTDAQKYGPAENKWSLSLQQALPGRAGCSRPVNQNQRKGAVPSSHLLNWAGQKQFLP